MAHTHHQTRSRVRVTRDEWHIEQHTGRPYGWEVVSSEETAHDARRAVREYRENQPEYPVRSVKRRVRIAGSEQ